MFVGIILYCVASLEGACDKDRLKSSPLEGEDLGEGGEKDETKLI